MGYVVRNKKQFYKAMLNSGFVMPSFKQSIISIKFMHKVRSDQIWMPLAPDVIACRSVAYPPTNAMLIDFIARAVPNLQNLGYTEEHIVAIKKLIKKVKKKGANKDWLLKYSTSSTKTARSSTSPTATSDLPKRSTPTTLRSLTTTTASSMTYPFYNQTSSRRGR